MVSPTIVTFPVSDVEEFYANIIVIRKETWDREYQIISEGLLGFFAIQLHYRRVDDRSEPFDSPVFGIKDNLIDRKIVDINIIIAPVPGCFAFFPLESNPLRGLVISNLVPEYKPFYPAAERGKEPDP
jgi:hypothetical protein